MFAFEEQGGAGRLADGALQMLAQRVRPVSGKRTRLLPVCAAIRPLLPDGLWRGATVRLVGEGAFSLAMAVAGGPSAAGSWCGLVGVGDPSPLAAAGYGIDLDRLVVVRPAPAQWALATAALLDGIDVVVVEPVGHPRPSAVRTLVARARDRGAVLLVVAGSWPVVPDVTLEVAEAQWHGLGHGAGRLQARRVTVTAQGRRGAVRPVRQELWLPAATGKVVAA